MTADEDCTFSSSGLTPLKHSIAFATPRRLTQLSFWLEHIPFGMFLVALARPRMIVELGTQAGDSYCAFCQAVAELGLDARCHAVDTWEGDQHIGPYGPEVLAELRAHHDPLYGAFSRLNASTFEKAVAAFSDGSIDILHIDGTHTYDTVRKDFETWLPKMSSRGVVLFHDTNVRESGFGVWKLWDELRSRYPHVEFAHGHGLGVLGVGEKLPKEVDDFFRACSAPGYAASIRALFAHLGHSIRLRRDLQSSREGLIREMAAKTRAEQEVCLQRAETALQTQLGRQVAETAGTVRDSLDAARHEVVELHAVVERLRAEQAYVLRALVALQASFAHREEDLAELIDGVRAMRLTSRDAATDAATEVAAQQEYAGFVRRVGEAVREHVPPGATALVVSRGDDELLKLCGAHAQHFLQDAAGTYAGHHPADSAEAIAQLEDLRRKGADFLVIPATDGWWLEHYASFRDHLDRHYIFTAGDGQACMIFDLRINR
jgi:hypothetical protein